MVVAIRAIYVHGMLGGIVFSLAGEAGEDIKSRSLPKVDVDGDSGEAAL